MDTRPAHEDTADDAALIEDAMKRCPPEAVEAAKAYRQSRDPGLAPAIVLGIVERFLEPEMREKLRAGGDELAFVDDLGVDSLTLVEIVMTVEQVLEVHIDNEELRDLRTVGDVTGYIDARLRGEGPAPRNGLISRQEIEELMPHSEPFLFLDAAQLREDGATATYLIQAQEFYLKGHFKSRPIVPASIMMEALGQLAVLFLLKSSHEGISAPVEADKVFFTACETVRCARLCKPEDQLDLAITVKRIRHPLAMFDGEITCGGERVATMKSVTLAFGYTQDSVPAANGTGGPPPAI